MTDEEKKEMLGQPVGMGSLARSEAGVALAVPEIPGTANNGGKTASDHFTLPA